MTQTHKPRDPKAYLRDLARAREAEAAGDTSAVKLHEAKFLGQNPTQELAHRVLVQAMRAVEPEFLSELVRGNTSHLGPILSSVLCVCAYAKGLRTPEFLESLKRICEQYWASSDFDPKTLTPEVAFTTMRDNLLRHPDQRFQNLTREAIK